MKKGQKKRIWTKEEKLKIIKRYSEEHLSARELGKIYNADHSMICRWIREYAVKGEVAFEEVKRSGNKYAALHTSKNISEAERLKLEIAKLRVENERLKKGYVVKGVGANKEFVTIKDVNTK
ncbi:MAG: transposase [Ruminococcaceae bacterium]|nr:transposase [Oscillospiraceae bacterium]